MSHEVASRTVHKQCLWNTVLFKGVCIPRAQEELILARVRSCYFRQFHITQQSRKEMKSQITPFTLNCRGHKCTEKPKGSMDGQIWRRLLGIVDWIKIYSYTKIGRITKNILKAKLEWHFPSNWSFIFYKDYLVRSWDYCSWPKQWETCFLLPVGIVYSYGL